MLVENGVWYFAPTWPVFSKPWRAFHKLKCQKMPVWGVGKNPQPVKGGPFSEHTLSLNLNLLR